jgi:hypothetical protein
MKIQEKQHGKEEGGSDEGSARVQNIEKSFQEKNSEERYTQTNPNTDLRNCDDRILQRGS